MATIRVKARPKLAEAEANRTPATLPRDRPAAGKGVASKAAGNVPAGCGSLREYLKANH
jgi:hypothetical protein